MTELCAMTDEKIYLNCPFDDKDECKSLGGRWDGDARKWYITDAMDSAPFAKWMGDDTTAPAGPSSGDVTPIFGDSENPAPPAGNPAPQGDNGGARTYLNCPYDDKDECKSLGGRWDGDMKKWYVPDGLDTAAFAKWLG
jgi:hypothetical protein